MEQRDKTFTIRKSMYVALVLLALGFILDIVSTIMFISKHDLPELETNLLYIAGVPLWLLMALSMVMLVFWLYYYIKRYYKCNVYMRYMLSYFLVFLIVLKFSFAISNFGAYNLDTDEIVVPTDEQKTEFHIEQVADMKAAEKLQPKGFKMPLALSMFLWSIVVFALWHDFEKGIIC